MQKHLLLKLTLLSILTLAAQSCTQQTTQTHLPTPTTPTDNPLKVSINGNLWRTMRTEFRLQDHADNPLVRRQITWFQHHPNALQDMVEQASPYIYYVYQQTKKRHIPAELALIPFVESEYKPFAYSKKGATGIWQMMPGTASGMGLKITWWYDGRRDIIASTHAALDYLTYQHHVLHRGWLLAVAGYDSGAGTIKRAILKNKRLGKKTDFWSLDLPQETKRYIPKLLAFIAIIRDPYRYGLELPPVNNAPYLKVVNVGSQMDFTQAAKLANMDVNLLRELNPGFRRWSTDPNGPFTLLLPIDKAQDFQEKLAALPKTKRVIWQHHRVTSGDTLMGLAFKYKTTVNIIRSVNRMKNNTIHLQQDLLVPVAYHKTINTKILEQRSTIAEDDIPGPHRIIHTVKKDDSLWKIAKLYSVKPQEIIYWNKFKSSKHIPVGQKIIIWSNTKRRLATSTYKIKHGDTLSTIALRFHTKTATLKWLNHLKNNTIRVGKTLTIPLT